MKRLVGLLFASALLALIVIPVARVGNSLPIKTDVRADGSGPAPPFPPPLVILLADGCGPAPPFPPPLCILQADGSGPAPPFPPPLVGGLFA